MQSHADFVDMAGQFTTCSRALSVASPQQLASACSCHGRLIVVVGENGRAPLLVASGTGAVEMVRLPLLHTTDINKAGKVMPVRLLAADAMFKLLLLQKGRMALGLARDRGGDSS